MENDEEREYLENESTRAIADNETMIEAEHQKEIAGQKFEKGLFERILPYTCRLPIESDIIGAQQAQLLATVLQIFIKDNLSELAKAASYGKLPPRKITLDDALRIYEESGIMGVADAFREAYAGYVQLADDQHPPQCPYNSLIFPTTIEEAGKFLTEKGLTDKEKSAVSGTIARLGWDNCQIANDEAGWRKVE